jgi:hypothetical protein
MGRETIPESRILSKEERERGQRGEKILVAYIEIFNIKL